MSSSDANSRTPLPLLRIVNDMPLVTLIASPNVAAPPTYSIPPPPPKTSPLPANQSASDTRSMAVPLFTIPPLRLFSPKSASVPPSELESGLIINSGDTPCTIFPYSANSTGTPISNTAPGFFMMRCPLEL